MKKPAKRLAVIGTGTAAAVIATFFLSWMTATAQLETPVTPTVPVSVRPPAPPGGVAVTSSKMPKAIEAPAGTLAPSPQPAVPASVIRRHAEPSKLFLRSSAAVVVDENEDMILYQRSADEQRPIASLTKLMTAIVILDTGLPLDAPIEITPADRDRYKGSKSRLRYGTILSRHDMLQVTIAASDNRAAAALARTYPGGKDVILTAMNAKAHELGMRHTRFADSAGLRGGNVSTARDLVKLARAIHQYPLIDTWSVNRHFRVTDQSTNKDIAFRNTNRLVHRDSWVISLSKTGYTAEAGNCLLMRAIIGDRPVIFVLLNSWGKLSKYGDSHRIRQWLLDIEHKIEVLLAASAST